MLEQPIFQNIDKGLLRKFEVYHAEHPEVFAQFRLKALNIKHYGFKKYSHVTIIEAIRWDVDIGGGKPFKINNDFKSLYARLMIDKYPEFEGFFELRTMKPFDRRESSEEIYRSKKGNTL